VYLLANQFGDELALLDGDGGDAGERFALLVFYRGEVADHENFGMMGKAEIGLDMNPSGAVGGGVEFRAERGCGDSGGPEDHGGGQARVAEVNCAGLDPGDHG